MTSAVSEKGQITIPKKLRDSLGLRPGTRLQFEERNGELVARRMRSDDPIDRAYGLLRGKRTDDLMRQLRGPKWDPKLDPESLDESS